jgi:phosphate transport system substrate-binding protein
MQRLVILGLVAGLLGCVIEIPVQQSGTQSSSLIRIDGSSTVEPLSAAIAQRWASTRQYETPVVRASGTGGGFEKFARRESDVSDASRLIKDRELQACREAGIEPLGLAVAIDGLTVVVNRQNTWCQALTVAQLREIWSKGSKIRKWSDIDPHWPEKELKLFSPDSKSGTFDYFKEAVIGTKPEDQFREDIQPSADDNQLVEGVAGQVNALGFFGYSYYVSNQEKLQAVAISPTDDPADAVAPTQAAIESGEYTPLSRPLYIYVARQDLRRPELLDFCRFYLSDEAQEIVKLKDFTPLPAIQLQHNRDLLEAAVREF